MTYQTIENFAAGLDTRKSPLTAPAGTMTRVVNALVTPGGELSKRRAFVNVAHVPGTFGLAGTESSLYVFGRNVAPSLPAWTVPGTTLKGLSVPNSATDMIQTDYDVFDGKIYLVCSQPSGADANAKNPHYYEDTVGGPMVLTEGKGKGFYVRTYQSKVYSVVGKFIYFSAIGDPKLWDTGTGKGYINLSLQDADAEQLTSIEVYYDKLAIFSTQSVQMWAVAADPAANAFTQLLRAAGTNSPRTPLQYGSGDVLFLDQSGIRSLKAKDSSNSASVSDIGSPVDPTMQAFKLASGEAYMDKAISLLEPSVGRFWMIFPDKIMVLSYFPGPKITAWSMLTLPELGPLNPVTHAVTSGGKVFLRDSQDNIWVYGGPDGTTYNNCGVEIRLPYLDGKKPGHRKQFMGFDATVSYQIVDGIPVTGAWRVAVSFDFNNPDAEETIATIDRPTWNAGRIEQQGYDSHFSLRFYNEDDKAATISNCAVHYEMADAET